ncbi:hypothetical protein TSUD_397520 [Trifolium subterraneum]|uniref:Endonuclease/exonuclease/phosphatase domain-containing protein n=1 Tax=Trifolium subterraneum TaxID=3900 RepID=A0A2Z6NEJ9_TRISU|nr:hypothetical protein TSUD_397520 [Trifolium subterraneum]
MWDSSEVEVWSSISREHVLWCHDRFLKTGEEFYLANVYAPCDMGAKRVLWDYLSGRIQSLNGERVCLCGDFNAARSIEERRSAREGPRSSDLIHFNCFIDDTALVDLPLNGRSLEGVQPIRQAVFTHFASHFKASTMDRPGVENLNFSQLTPREGGSLDFWSEMQANIMRFMAEFHRNGRLSKGINSTFIALIPKVDSPHRLNDFRPISVIPHFLTDHFWFGV